MQLVFPAPALEDPFLNARGQFEWSLEFAETNTLNRVGSGASGTGLLFDLETSRVVLHARYGLSERWELQLMVPFVRRWGGVFDRSIERVERAVGQENSLREIRPRNDYFFSYRHHGEEVFHFGPTGQSGLADISVGIRSLAWTSDDSRARLVLGGQVELPAGREEELFGNGGVDLVLSALGFLRKDRASWLAQVNFVAPADLLEDAGIESEAYVTAAIGAILKLSDRVALVFQLDYYSSPLSKTAVRELERDLWEFGAGVNLRLSAHWLWQIGGVENLVVEPGADFSLVSRIVYQE